MTNILIYLSSTYGVSYTCSSDRDNYITESSILYANSCVDKLSAAEGLISSLQAFQLSEAPIV